MITSQESPLREERTRAIPNEGRESTEPLASNAALSQPTRFLLADGTPVQDRIGQDALGSTHSTDLFPKQGKLYKITMKIFQDKFKYFYRSREVWYAGTIYSIRNNVDYL